MANPRRPRRSRLARTRRTVEENNEESSSEDELSPSSSSSSSSSSSRSSSSSSTEDPVSAIWPKPKTSDNKRKPKPPTHVKLKGQCWLFSEEDGLHVKVDSELTVPICTISFIESNDAQKKDLTNKRYIIISEGTKFFVDKDEYERVRKIVLPNEERPEAKTQCIKNALYGMEVT